MKKATHKTIRAMAQRLAEEFEPERIILFGSYARGNPSPDSDVDLLVVMNHREKRFPLLQRMRRCLSEFDVPKDIVIRTPDEVARFGRFVGTIIYPALKEGRTLYVKD